jgi:hypothetical protein
MHLNGNGSISNHVISVISGLDSNIGSVNYFYNSTASNPRPWEQQEYVHLNDVGIFTIRFTPISVLFSNVF